MWLTYIAAIDGREMDIICAVTFYKSPLTDTVTGTKCKLILITSTFPSNFTSTNAFIANLKCTCIYKDMTNFKYLGLYTKSLNTKPKTICTINCLCNGLRQLLYQLCTLTDMEFKILSLLNFISLRFFLYIYSGSSFL